MKSYFTLLAFTLLSVVLGAQSQRLVLVEHYTQASCPPCASINPGMNRLLDANTDKVVALKYQVSWPGYDPMYEHNKSQITTRTRYYDVTAVPNSVMNGQSGPGSPNTIVTQATIDAAYAKPSPFELKLSHKLGPRLDEVLIELEITASQAIDEEMVAQIAVVEEEIHFALPPGSTNEKDFFHVMKRMLPTDKGTSLPKTWASGQKQTITAVWKFENVYDISEIAVVAFVQNPATKEVHQAAWSEPNLAPAGQADALVTRANANGSFSLQEVCGGMTRPQVEVMNAAFANLKTLEIHYAINGGAEQIFIWKGDLPYLQKTLVDLPAYFFSPSAVSNLSVRLAKPNGIDDAQPSNDSFTSQFSEAIAITPILKVEVRPFSLPGKVSWEIRNDLDELVASGGPYTQSLQTQTHNLVVEGNRCYRALVKNEATGFNGYFKILDDKGAEQFKIDLQGAFTWVKPFGSARPLATENPLSGNAVILFPNPASHLVTLDIQLDNPEPVHIALVNSLGQQVQKHTVELPSGKHQHNLDVSDVQPGMYSVQIAIGKSLTIKSLAVGSR
jgi:hypothetical protein